MTDAELIESLLTATPDLRQDLEVELQRRAADPVRRRTLRALLEPRAQDADEYLGASAEAARHYLSLLSLSDR